MTTKSLYEMSDDELLASAPPPIDRAADALAEEAALQRHAGEVATSEPVTPVVPEVPVANPEDTSNTPPVVTEQATPNPAATTEPVVPAKDETAPVEVVPPATPVETLTAEVETPPNYEELYQKVMAPFRANGKDITLKDVDEVRQLLSMGANYTKNMQQIAPQRKTLMALQQAGINAEQLNFLIDLHQKKPEAIARLVAQAEINPVDIDTSNADNYRAGNHQVTDQQVAFQTVLDDVSSSDGGQATIDLLNKWDPASQQAAFADPKIISDFHAHQSNGVYAKVSAELDRARMLGQIPESVPYVQAYGHVFNEMSKAGAFEEPKPAPTPVAVRVVAPKPVVTNNEQAQAAAPTAPNTSKVTETQPNWLEMDDKKFMEHFEKFRTRL